MPQSAEKLHPVVAELQHVFTAHADTEKAEGMSRYMKNLFSFHGISKPERAVLQKHFVQRCKTIDAVDIITIARQLWSLPQREYQYTCMDMLKAVNKKWNEPMLQFFLKLVGEKSWWDTVDMIATNLMGAYCLRNHEQYKPMMIQLSKHDNIWYNRVALIHQLKYKQHTDAKLLMECIFNCMHKKEFFIQKGIGWALRQYAYVNANFVKRFAETQPLSNLAKREALKHIQ
jgi:3-methyladenine DNA glycosylase AlkD